MALKKRTETTTETHEVWVVSTAPVMGGLGNRPPDSCAVCGALGRMRTPEQSAFLSGLRTREVYALVEAGRAHFEERSDGELFICLASLAADVG